MIFIAFILLFLLQLYTLHSGGCDEKEIFYWAAYPKCINFLKNALENGANPNYREGGISSFQMAVANTNISAITLLLDYGADINPKNSSCLSPLTAVCKRDVTETTDENKKLIIFLLQNGADPNLDRTPEYSPLFRANNDMIKILLLYGANPYLKSVESCTVITVLENWKLLEKADYIKQTSKKLFLILTKLLHRGTVAGGIKLPLDMAKLIASYCYPQEENFMGKSDYFSMLEYAKDPNKIELLQDALESGANPNQLLQYHPTFLQAATNRNNFEAIKMLLKYGADINCASDAIPQNPLAIACSTEKKELLQLLLQKGADPNLYACQLFNPLISVRYDKEDDFFINMLFIYGANPHLKDKYGDTIMNLLGRNFHFKHADYIKEKYKKIFAMLVKLLYRGTVAGGIRLPLDMARLIVSYCYPQ